jgi:hypothetical protein
MGCCNSKTQYCVGWYGCRRMVRNKQIINWDMSGLPSEVCVTAMQLLLLATCRWIRRRSWGRLLLVLLKGKMGGLAAYNRCLLCLWRKGGHIGIGCSGSKLLLFLRLFFEDDYFDMMITWRNGATKVHSGGGAEVAVVAVANCCCH